MSEEYVLLAEYSALAIIIVVLLSFFRDYESRTLRYKLLRYMYYATFVLICVTIVSTQMIQEYFNIIPYGITEFVNILYFLITPTPAFFCLLYAISLTENHSDEEKTSKKVKGAIIPYGCYVIWVLANYFHHLIFYIDVNEGYVRGPLFQIAFYLTVFFAVSTVFISVINHRSANRGTLLVLCINLMLVLGISFVQYYQPHLTLTGIASVAGVLVVHLYIQNVSKSTDKLTGLSNRMALMFILGRLASRNERFSLYVISIRNFKSVNERQGLESGDKVLKYIASRVAHYFGYFDSFRYNGDEFAVLIKKHGAQEHNKLEKLIAEFDEPFIVDGYELDLDVLYCRVDFPDFGSNVRALISATDYSIRTLKENSGESNFLYDTTIGEKVRARNEMVQRLKEAIENDGFEVHYQAIFSTKHDTFSQAEALVRMKDGAGGLIYPGEFIDIAENTRLIIKMTYIILEKTCSHIRELIDEQGKTCTLESISINFPYIQFLQDDLLERVTSILDKYNIPPKMIKIEITERTLISDAKSVKHVMEEMQKIGFVFELDDFGVDYSNMSTFLNLPVNVIKIDRSLLLAATTTAQNENFFEHLINGIKATDRVSVIEGVESLEQLEFLKSCGCEHIQGFVFSKPLPFDEFKKFLLENSIK